MSRAIIIVSLSLLACADSKGAPETVDSSTSGGEDEMVCEPGRDQTCNDNPAISSLHGRCLADRTCECVGGVEKNPETGRCL